MDPAYQNALDLARWERQLADASYTALRKWLPQAEAAVLPSLTAAGPVLPPDPNGLSAVEQAWANLVDIHVMPLIERLMLGQIAKSWRKHGVTEQIPATPVESPVRNLIDGKKSQDARTVYRLASTRSRTQRFLDTARTMLSRQPSSVENLLTKAVETGRAKNETNDELRARVAALVRDTPAADWRKKAENLSRTVATGAFNGAHLFAAQAREQVLGIELEKVWLATIDSRTRDSHFAADGQRRRLDQPFNVGGASLDRPGDPTGPAEEVLSCRCTMLELEPGDALPGETDRQTERGPGDSTVKNREGSRQDEIDRRTHEGVVRAREDPDGEGIVASAAPDGGSMEIEWSGILAPLGKPTGDDRIFALDMELEFREFPLPLMWQKQTSDFPHSQAFTVGSIRSASIENGEVVANGIIFGDSEVTAEVLSQLREGVTRPSVDLCEDEWELVDEDGSPVSEEDMWVDVLYAEEGDDPDATTEEPKKVFMQFTKATVMGATLVAKPAFAEAKITLYGEGDDEDTEPPADQPVDATAKADAEIDSEFANVKHDGDESTPDDTPDKTPAEDQEPGTEPEADGTDDGSGDKPTKGKPKTDKKTPTATGKPDAPKAEDAPPPLKGDAAGSGKTADSDDSDTEDDAHDDSKSKTKSKGGKKGKNPFDKASMQERERQLVAAAPLVQVFQSELFEAPTGILPTDGQQYDRKTGRVFGYLAAWDSCHRGIQSKCIIPPRTGINYADFHQHWVETEKGVLHVGALTVGCGHATNGESMYAALEHYDNAGSMWAKVRVGEDEHGIWYSGVVLSSTKPRDLQLALGTPVSGDWRQHGGVGGALELCAVLSVVTPGYARPAGAHDENGRPRSLVAAGIPQQPQRRKPNSKPTKAAHSAREIADAAVDAYARRQANLSRVQGYAQQLGERDKLRASVMRRRLSMRMEK